MKQLNIQGKTFISATTTCLMCNRRFKYKLPIEGLFYWSRLCSVCDPTTPDEKPKRGEVFWLFEAMPAKMPWD